MKVLIVKLSALGDILHAMPAVERVIHSRIETGWVVDTRYASVLQLFPGLDHLHVLDVKDWGRTARSGRFIDAFSQIKESLKGIRVVGYDKVLDIQGLLKVPWLPVSQVAIPWALQPVCAGSHLVQPSTGSVYRWIRN